MAMPYGGELPRMDKINSGSRYGFFVCFVASLGLPGCLEGEGEARCLQSARSLLDAAKSYTVVLKIYICVLYKTFKYGDNVIFLFAQCIILLILLLVQTKYKMH